MKDKIDSFEERRRLIFSFCTNFESQLMLAFSEIVELSKDKKHRDDINMLKGRISEFVTAAEYIIHFKPILDGATEAFNLHAERKKTVKRFQESLKAIEVQASKIDQLLYKPELEDENGFLLDTSDEFNEFPRSSSQFRDFINSAVAFRQKTETFLNESKGNIYGIHDNDPAPERIKQAINLRIGQKEPERFYVSLIFFDLFDIWFSSKVQRDSAFLSVLEIFNAVYLEVFQEEFMKSDNLSLQTIQEMMRSTSWKMVYPD